jgi:hypothetical protein
VTIAVSVYAHGLTARPLTERYVRWWDSHPLDAQPAMESVPAAEHRLRTAHPDRMMTPTNHSRTVRH